MNHYRYDEIEVGQSERFEVCITEEKMEAFHCLSGDENPLHNDEAYAKKAGFPNRVAYGMLTSSFLSTLAGVYLPGEYSLIHTVSVDFLQPVLLGDTLCIEGTVSKKMDAFRAICLQVTVTNQHGEKVCGAKMRIGVLQ